MSEHQTVEAREIVESIRARLNSYRCSLCRGWLTPEAERPHTFSVGTEMCSCPRGVHNSLVPDVDWEDTERLLALYDALLATIEGKLAAAEAIAAKVERELKKRATECEALADGYAERDNCYRGEFAAHGKSLAYAHSAAIVRAEFATIGGTGG